MVNTIAFLKMLFPMPISSTFPVAYSDLFLAVKLTNHKKTCRLFLPIQGVKIDTRETIPAH